MAKNAKKAKASYKGYSELKIDENALEQAYSLIRADKVDLLDWLDIMRTRGYEFQFERSDDLEGATGILKQTSLTAIDSGLWLFTGGLTYLESLCLIWYKFEIVGGARPLIQKEASAGRRYY